MVAAAKNGYTCINVMCDDTDVFRMLLHYYLHCKLACTVLMEGTSSKRNVINIGASANKLIFHQLLAAHTLTGCDTVAYIFGVRKECKNLDKLGDSVAIVEEVIEEATKFVDACCGSKTQESISKVRYHIWAKRTSSKKITKTLRLKSLPPTSESLAENIKSAHIQTYIWKAAMKQYPPCLDPTDFGWYEVTKSLSPVTTPTNTATVPTKVFQMIRCGCSQIFIAPLLSVDV